MIGDALTYLLKQLLPRWLTWTLDAVKKAWRWIIASPAHILAVVLVVSIACNVILWRRAADYSERLSNVAHAQTDAADAQIAVNHEPARKSAAIAEKSNAEAPAYRARVNEYAAASRVRTVVPGCRSDLPGADSPVASVHGPAATAVEVPAAAELVCRPQGEDDLLVHAAGRAAQMRQEALDLIAAGVAVASTELEQPIRSVN